MSPLHFERLDSVCATSIQHQMDRKLSISEIVTTYFFLLRCLRESLILSRWISRFFSLWSRPSISKFFDLFRGTLGFFSDVLPTSVKSFTHTSFYDQKAEQFFQSNRTNLTSSTDVSSSLLPRNRLITRLSFKFFVIQELSLWLFLNVDHLRIHHGETRSMVSDRKTYVYVLIVVLLWILILHMTSSQIVIRRNKRWLICQSIP